MIERILLMLTLICSLGAAIYSYKDYEENHKIHLIQGAALQSREILRQGLENNIEEIFDTVYENQDNGLQ